MAADFIENKLMSWISYLPLNKITSEDVDKNLPSNFVSEQIQEVTGLITQNQEQIFKEWCQCAFDIQQTSDAIVTSEEKKLLSVFANQSFVQWLHLSDQLMENLDCEETLISFNDAQNILKDKLIKAIEYIWEISEPFRETTQKRFADCMSEENHQRTKAAITEQVDQVEQTYKTLNDHFDLLESYFNEQNDILEDDEHSDIGVSSNGTVYIHS